MSAVNGGYFFYVSTFDIQRFPGNDVEFTNVETQTWTVVSGLPALWPVTPPPSPDVHIFAAWLKSS